MLTQPPEIPRISLSPQWDTAYTPRARHQQGLGLLWHPRPFYRLPYLLATALHVHLLPSKSLHYPLPRTTYQDRIIMALHSIRSVVCYRLGYQLCIHMLLCRCLVHGPRLQR